MERTKSCPICGAEFRHQVQMCPDCGVELQWNPEPEDPRHAGRTPFDRGSGRAAVNKICPACLSEYQPQVQQCADCDVPLEWNRGLVDLEALRQGSITENDANWGRFEDHEILGLLVGDVEWVAAAYLKFLREEGIPAVALPRMRYVGGKMNLRQSISFGFLLDGGTANEVPVGDLVDGFHFDLFVRKRDHETAAGIVDRHFEALHPENRDGLYQEFETDACPACGCALEGAPQECPDCGLYLGG